MPSCLCQAPSCVVHLGGVLAPLQATLSRTYSVFDEPLKRSRPAKDRALPRVWTSRRSGPQACLDTGHDSSLSVRGNMSVRSENGRTPLPV